MRPSQKKNINSFMAVFILSLLFNSNGNADFSFTKLDNNGNPLANTASTWSCVKENVTGLIWEVKTSDGGLHDKDQTYTWYNSTGTNDGDSAGVTNEGTCSDSGYCDTEKFVQRVNAQSWCGANDWRMPTKAELLGLVSLDRTNPAIDISYFPNTISSYYLSASPNANHSHLIWAVYFDDGDLNNYYKGVSKYVRLVRAGQ